MTPLVHRGARTSNGPAPLCGARWTAFVVQTWDPSQVTCPRCLAAPRKEYRLRRVPGLTHPIPQRRTP